MKAEFITYTENEVAAIETLRAHAGVPMTAKELGIANAVLTSLIKKANDERPMAEGLERVVVNKVDYEETCPTCGAVKSGKKYFID